jgi:hypothetical protein
MPKRSEKFIVYDLCPIGLNGTPGKVFAIKKAAKKHAQQRADEIEMPIKVDVRWQGIKEFHGVIFPSNWNLEKREAWTRSVHGTIVPKSFMPD